MLTLAIAMAAWPAIASADWFLTPFAGLKFAGESRIVDLDQGASNTKFTLGGIVGMTSDGLLGVETDVGYSPRFFERSSGMLIARSHVLTVMGNIVLTTPQELTGDSLRPFVSGGAGLLHDEIHDILG